MASVIAAARRIVVQTAGAPAALGPYSQAIVANGVVYSAGQIGLAPGAPALAVGVDAQTRQAIANLKAVLEAAGSSLGHVLKTTVFLKSMDDFNTMNSAYAEYFGPVYPSRSAVEVARLPKDALVEIECVALVDKQ